MALAFLPVLIQPLRKIRAFFLKQYCSKLGPSLAENVYKLRKLLYHKVYALMEE